MILTNELEIVVSNLVRLSVWSELKKRIKIRLFVKLAKRVILDKKRNLRKLTIQESRNHNL